MKSNYIFYNHRPTIMTSQMFYSVAVNMAMKAEITG